MSGLTDKTIVLAGPFGLLIQTLTARLTESGADVALVTDDIKAASRICQNILDMREVSEKNGRAVALDIPITNEKSAANIFSKAAEQLGGVDVYIDTHLFGLQIPFYKNEVIGDIDQTFNAAFQKLHFMTQSAASFLKSRTRGKILYIFHELDLWSADKADTNVYIDFIEYVRKTGMDLIKQNTGVNALAVGISEEFLLTRFGKNKTIQMAQQELVKHIPHAKLVDYNDISNTASFLVSPQATGISGQVINLDFAL